MEKNGKSAEWYPIDAGGVIQFLTGIREQSPVILIDYGLREPVDKNTLRAATQKALELFPVFRVRLALDNPDRKPVYEVNPDAADVYPYDGKPHAFGRESNGYLFRVYYTDKRILLSMHHILTDGSGAHEFLKSILYFYFNAAEGNPEEIRKLLPVDPEDRRDPYTVYGDPEAREITLKNKWRNELEIPNRMHYRRGEPAVVHRMLFSISDFLTTVQRAESSVFPLLTTLMGKAVAKVYGGEDRILTGAGAFNCRHMFRSRTPRSFSQTFLTVLDPRERDLDLNTQLTVQRARMDIELQKETISRSVAGRREQADRMLENAEQYILDQDRLDAERRESARKSTYFLSYLGHFDSGEAIEPYIDSVDYYSTVTRVPIVASGFERNGILHLKTLEIGCENSIAPALLETAGAYDLAGRMEDSFEICFDSFPMEELYQNKSENRYI